MIMARRLTINILSNNPIKNKIKKVSLNTLKNRNKHLDLSTNDRRVFDSQDVSAKFHEYHVQCLKTNFDSLITHFNEIS